MSNSKNDLESTEKESSNKDFKEYNKSHIKNARK